MNIRKTVKKIAALVAGTTMLGATIMGATDATKRIRTGDIVEMECGTGRVFLAPRERDRSE